MTSAMITWKQEPAEPAAWEVGQAARLTGPICRTPGIWGGKAVIAGTRVPVFMVVDLFEAGEAADAIVRRYPRLTLSDVYGALFYAFANRAAVVEDRREHEAAIERYRPA